MLDYLDLDLAMFYFLAFNSGKAFFILGTLVALPLEMHCKHTIQTLHAVKTMN